VNLNDNTIEIFENPDPASQQYRTKTTAQRGEIVRLRVGEGEAFAFDAAEVLP
jgi:hypothetical protein